MTRYKDEIFAQVEQALAAATPAQIEQLLRDIAMGRYPATAQTRAGANDDSTNVASIVEAAEQARRKSMRAVFLAEQVALKSRALRAFGKETGQASVEAVHRRVAS